MKVSLYFDVVAIQKHENALSIQLSDDEILGDFRIAIENALECQLSEMLNEYGLEIKEISECNFEAFGETYQVNL